MTNLEYRTTIAAITMRIFNDPEKERTKMSLPFPELLVVPDPVMPKGNGWELLETTLPRDAEFVMWTWKRTIPPLPDVIAYKVRIADLEQQLADALAVSNDIRKERDTFEIERDALRGQLSSANIRIQDFTIQGKELVEFVRHGTNGIGHKIVSRPCTTQACKGAVCAPVQAFWDKVRSFELLLAKGDQ